MPIDIILIVIVALLCLVGCLAGLAERVGPSKRHSRSTPAVLSAIARVEARVSKACDSPGPFEQLESSEFEVGPRDDYPGRPDVAAIDRASTHRRAGIRAAGG